MVIGSYIHGYLPPCPLLWASLYHLLISHYLELPANVNANNYDQLITKRNYDFLVLGMASQIS